MSNTDIYENQKFEDFFSKQQLKFSNSQDKISIVYLIQNKLYFNLDNQFFWKLLSVHLHQKESIQESFRLVQIPEIMFIYGTKQKLKYVGRYSKMQERILRIIYCILPQRWQNDIMYAQKINCSKEIVSKIFVFESFEYQQNWQDGIIKYEVPFKECFNLKHLIDSLSLNYIKIYKGQVLIIANEIIQHLKQLHLNNLSHGQLEPKNIFISLKNKKDNRLTIYQVPIHIKRINFINYKVIEDENYQVNQIADIQQIIKSIQQFIQVIEDYQQCQLLQLINNQLQQINVNINQNSLQELCILFNQLINNHVDLQTQQIKKGLYRESPNYESRLGNRYRGEGMIINYLEQLNVFDLYQSIEIQMNNNFYPDQNEPFIYQNQILLQEDQNSNDNEQQIKLILFNSIRNTILLQFWALFGEKLKSWTVSFNSIIEEFQNKTNINLLQLPQWFQRIKSTLIIFQNEIPQQITDQIQQQFKFDFEIDQDIKNQIAQIFFQQLLIQFSYFDFFNDDIDNQVFELRQNIEQKVTNYYLQQSFIKISKMTLQLV